MKIHKLSTAKLHKERFLKKSSTQSKNQWGCRSNSGLGLLVKVIRSDPQLSKCFPC